MSSSEPTGNGLRPETTAVLNQLRRGIRRYVFIEGVALVVALFGALFWGSFLIDIAYFRLSRLELPRWFRAAVLITGLVLLTFGLVTWIALRLLRSLQTRALALVLERRFPELDDRLITAVEAAEQPEHDASAFTTALLNQTIDQAARATSALELAQVFDRRPIRRALVIASLVIASLLGLAVADSAAMERWIAGYLSLRSAYWPRETELILRVVQQPGDRLRDFVDRSYKHAKGTDLTLQVDVAPGKAVPRQVRLDARLANGRGMVRVTLTRLDGQTFRHTMAGLLDDAELWITGGDFTNATPFHVEVVQPPDLTQAVLHCQYPAYTGLNPFVDGKLQRTTQQVNGAQTTLPLDTDFILEATANKSLVQVRIEGDAGPERWEVVLQVPESSGSKQASAVLKLKSQDGRPELAVSWPAAVADRIWSADRTVVALPFVLAPDGASRLPALIAEARQRPDALTLPLPLPPDSALRISLEDRDGIASLTPARLTINGIVDQPPTVKTELRGIGSSITRKARIPVAGQLSDDYGVLSARFDYRVDDASAWLPREFQTPPTGVREFDLQRSETEPFERFDVLPLDLSIGKRLTLSVTALDGCTVKSVPTATAVGHAAASNEPAGASELPAHRAYGMKYVFTIVSEEELLSMLYAREINIRKRFEQIITELKQTRAELTTQREKLSETGQPVDPNLTADARTALTQGLAGSADRSLHSIRKNATETAGVQASFADIREELVNNAADTPLMLERLDDRILAPLDRIMTGNFPKADTSLGLFKLAQDKSTNPVPTLEESIDELQTIIQGMESILSEMRELAKFHEVVEQLKANIKAQQELLEETRRKRKESAIKGLLD